MSRSRMIQKSRARGIGPGQGLAALLLFAATMIAPGCMTWKRGWEIDVPRTASSSVEAAEGILKEVRALETEADTAGEVIEIVDLCRSAVAAAPEYRPALDRLARYCNLMGAAYSETRSEKKKWYTEALQSGERAMYINPRFREAIDGGRGLDAALATLGEEDMGAMFLWTTAVNYYFKECLPVIAYPFHVRWVKRTKGVLDQMWEIDPEWGRGGLYFSLGIYYLALPERVGGDMEKSAQMMEEAVDKWPESILFRWGRAKYWQVKAGNREGFVEDLEWVLQQDPARPEPWQYPWNVYFQRDARLMLLRINRLF